MEIKLFLLMSMMGSLFRGLSPECHVIASRDRPKKSCQGDHRRSFADVAFLHALITRRLENPQPIFATCAVGPMRASVLAGHETTYWSWEVKSQETWVRKHLATNASRLVCHSEKGISEWHCLFSGDEVTLNHRMLLTCSLIGIETMIWCVACVSHIAL